MNALVDEIDLQAYANEAAFWVVIVGRGHGGWALSRGAESGETLGFDGVATGGEVAGVFAGEPVGNGRRRRWHASEPKRCGRKRKELTNLTC